MKPWIHAENSAKKFGGKPRDYIKIHDWMDQSKAHFPDMRHRALLHSSFGIYLCEQVFGTRIQIKYTPVGGAGVGFKCVQVRDIAEHHVIEDMGFIPTVQDYLAELPFYSWLGGKTKKKRVMKLSDVELQFVDKRELSPPTQPNAGTMIID